MKKDGVSITFHSKFMYRKRKLEFSIQTLLYQHLNADRRCGVLRHHTFKATTNFLNVFRFHILVLYLTGQ